MIITADLGSSFLKLSQLSSSTGESLVSHRIRVLPVPTGNPHEAEFDLKQLADAVRAFIVSASPAPEAVLLTAQMHGYVLRHDPDGRVGNYVSWQDERSLYDAGGTMEHLRQAITPDLLAPSGLHLKQELALCNLCSELNSRGYSAGDCTLFTLGSYIIYALTGENRTHLTSAAATGLYDIAACRPNDSLLHAAGLDGLRLPVAAGGIEPCGTFHGIPVFTDTGDHPTAVFGIGAGAKDVTINMGTTSQVSVIRDRFSPQEADSLHELRPYFGGKYLRTATKLPGGRSLQLLADFFADTVRKLTGTRPDNAAVWSVLESVDLRQKTDLTVKTGFYPSLRSREGAIEGIQSENLTLENILRGAYGDIAQTFLSMAERLQPGHSSFCISGKFAEKMETVLRLYADRDYRFTLGDGRETERGLWKLYRDYCDGGNAK